MNVTRFASAPEYFPSRHDGMRCVRLQGHEAGPTDTVWIGVSQIEPGGGTSLDTNGYRTSFDVQREVIP